MNGRQNRSDRLDTELARRFNFLGFPSEESGGLSFGFDKLGVALPGAVDRVVQSLTPDERRTIAEGGTIPPHVQTWVSAEIAIAKLQ